MARLSVALGGRQRRMVLALHPGWLPILAIVAWLAAMWQGPQAYPEHGLQSRWLLGAAVALAMLASVAFREMLRVAILRYAAVGDSDGRSLYLTLYPYGGALRPSPLRLPWRRQAALALAGPLTSAGLALVLGALWFWGAQPFYAWLALLNLGLALLTLAPARPLDGGQLLEALGREGRLERVLVERITHHGTEFLAATLIWLGGLSLLLTQFPPGLLLVALGFLLQIHDEPPEDEPDLERERLLNRYSVRDVVQQSRQDRRALSPSPQHIHGAEAPGVGLSGLPRRPGRGGSDGSALPWRQGPSLQRHAVSITAGLGTVWRRLHEQNTRLLLVVDDYRIVGICSRAKLLAYLRSRVPRESE